MSALVLVTFAVADEARPFRAWAARHDQIRPLVTGIGAARTRTALAEFLGRQPVRVIFTCGFAGGLNPQYARGSLLFETSPGFPFRAQLEAAQAIPARFHSSPRVLATSSEKAAAYRATGADAVEMESSVVHGLCRERGIPCATVRVILDAAGEDLPLDFNQVTTADQQIHYGKLMAKILQAPGRIPRLLRLQREAARAAQTLANGLEAVIGGLPAE